MTVCSVSITELNAPAIPSGTTTPRAWSTRLDAKCGRVGTTWTVRLEAWQAPPGDRIPNNPRFPVLIYHEVDAAAAGADAARRASSDAGFTVVGGDPAGQEKYDL